MYLAKTEGHRHIALVITASFMCFLLLHMNFLVHFSCKIRQLYTGKKMHSQCSWSKCGQVIRSECYDLQKEENDQFPTTPVNFFIKISSPSPFVFGVSF